jgi:hypothetical protein
VTYFADIHSWLFFYFFHTTTFYFTHYTEQQWKCFGGESSKPFLILGRWVRIWQLKLLIGATFKDLGWVLICTLYTAFGIERLKATIWQLLSWREWCSQHPGISSAVHQKGEAVQRGKVDDEISPQVLPLPTFCISVHSRVLHCTHVCFSFQKIHLSQREMFINALKVLYSRFLAERQ